MEKRRLNILKRMESSLKSTAKIPTISVVIPSYRPGEVLYRCLDAVVHQRIEIPYEVILVDSSPKDTSDSIHASFPDVRVIHLKQRTLPGKARSIGASRAGGDVIFFTDTDCIVNSDWMKTLWEVHQSGYSVVGGSVLNGTPGSIIGTAEYLLEFVDINPGLRPREVRTLPTCNLAVDKKIFDKVGFFPDLLKGEDTLFCDKVTSNGDKIYYLPKAKITHVNRVGFLHYLKNQMALGEGSHETRRRIKQHGQFLMKYPVLIPFIPIYRTVRIGSVWLKSNFRLFILFVMLYPLILLGILAHTWGFIRGSRR